MQSMILHAGLVLALALPAAACSTARHDGTTVPAVVEMTIDSTPEGARCVLERRGKEIAVIDKTPQTVSFDRSAREITVKCTLDRHISSLDFITSTYVGGPLKPAPSPLAGLIAAAIVAGSPANYEYPSHFSVSMDANEFPDAAAREAKYAERREIILERHKNRLEKVKNECPSAEVCRTEQQGVDAMRDAELAELDSFKAKAQIVPPAPPQPEKSAKPPAKKAG